MNINSYLFENLFYNDLEDYLFEGCAYSVKCQNFSQNFGKLSKNGSIFDVIMGKIAVHQAYI